MGAVSAVFDAFTGLKLKSFSAMQMSADHSFQRRSGTYVVAGADGGIDPFGLNSLPTAIRNVSYQFREYFNPRGITDDTHHTDPDSARDALMLAVGGGAPVKLEYTTSKGLKRYAYAKAKDYPQTLAIDSDKWADFKITFELRDTFWSDQAPINAVSWGGFTWGSFTWGGTTPLLLNTGGVFQYNYAIDLTGATAFDLCKITVDGPWGGSTGFTIANNSLSVPTSTGIVFPTLQYLEPLLTGESVTIDPAAMTVTKILVGGSHQDAFTKLSWPNFQKYMMWVDPHTNAIGSAINTLQISGTGTSLTNGGRLSVLATKRYW